jgi:hypothetical protein
MEKIVVSKAKVDFLRVLRYALRAEKRTIANLQDLVTLREQRIECVTKQCYGRVARRTQVGNWRLTASRVHYGHEKRLYKMTVRMLKLVKMQARGTVTLAQCDTRVCRHDTRFTLRRLTRHIDRLHRSLERKAQRTHLIRHAAARNASARLFRDLRQKLIVKRAGCTTRNCVKVFTRRIDLYARIIARILASRAPPRKKFKSSVSKVDHALLAKPKVSRREREDRAEEEMEELASQMGFLKAPPCVKHLADLHSNMSKAIKAGDDVTVKRLQKVIDNVNCPAAGDDFDELKQRVTEVVDVRTTATQATKATTTTTAKPTPAPLTCIQKLANLHEAYSKALTAKNQTGAALIQKEIGELACGDEMGEDDDFTTASTTVASTLVPIEQSCATKQANLHAQLSAALAASNVKLATDLRKQLDTAKDECRDSLQDACQEEMDAVEAKRADFNLELTGLFNEESKCANRQCRAHLDREIRKVKKSLKRLKTPSC